MPVPLPEFPRLLPPLRLFGAKATRLITQHSKLVHLRARNHKGYLHGKHCVWKQGSWVAGANTDATIIGGALERNHGCRGTSLLFICARR